MSGEQRTRRSFLVDLMNKAAGVWILLLGGSALSSGCGEQTAAYGGPPGQDASTPMPDAAYGGPWPTDASTPMMDAAYGGPTGEDASTPEDASDPHVDAAYGGPWGRDF